MFSKNCNCGRIQKYKRNSDLIRSIKKNTKCIFCSNKKENNPMFGKKQSSEMKEKLRISKLGEKNPQFGKKGILSPSFGKKASIETKEKFSKLRKIYTLESLYSSKRQKSHFYDWIREKQIGFEKYVGCSLNEFKNYIQSQFKESMSWENHGKTTWHLDHIKPLSSFDLTNEEEVKKAWHYTNFQPLLAKENLSKGSKVNKIYE